jgi:hypothetical protein
MHLARPGCKGKLSNDENGLRGPQRRAPTRFYFPDPTLIPDQS